MLLANPRSSHNKTHAVGNRQSPQRLSNFRAVITLNAAGDTARFRVVGH